MYECVSVCVGGVGGGGWGVGEKSFEFKEKKSFRSDFKRFYFL